MKRKGNFFGYRDISTRMPDGENVQGWSDAKQKEKKMLVRMLLFRY